MKIKHLPITLEIILSMILGACTPAAAPTPETTIVEKTVVVKEIVEVIQTAVPQEAIGPVEPVANPYRPDNLFEVVAKLQEAIEG